MCKVFAEESTPNQSNWPEINLYLHYIYRKIKREGWMVQYYFSKVRST